MQKKEQKGITYRAKGLGKLKHKCDVIEIHDVKETTMHHKLLKDI